MRCPNKIVKLVLLGGLIFATSCFPPNPVEILFPDEGEIFYSPTPVPIEIDIDCGIDWESCRGYLGEGNPTSPYYNYCFSPSSVYVSLEEGGQHYNIPTQEFTVEVQKSDGEVRGATLSAQINPLNFPGFTFGKMTLQLNVGLIPTIASPTGCSRLYDFGDEVGFEYKEWGPQPLP